MLALALLVAVDSAAIMAEVDRLAKKPLWPGFDPRTTPVAIYDGARTRFFHHPAPPADFTPPRANTSVELGGVLTATVLVDRQKPAAEWAPIVIHESFHVFQRKRHAVWSANEGDLFTYPLEDPQALALRRLESMAFARALRDSCWTSAALKLRKERFLKLPPEAIAYERKSELNEGLAQYVERLAAGRKPEWPEAEFPPDGIRLRSYVAGETLAVLLDRARPEWKRELESGDPRPLDELLAGAPKPAGCAPTEDERQSALERAQKDVEALRARRADKRKEVEGRRGVRVVVRAELAPLWPQAFDPWNVERLGGSELLHTRWLKLGNDAGAIEVLGRDALTDGAGAHPLFQGVKTLMLTGFEAEPTVTNEGGVLHLEGGGVTLDLKGARLSKNGPIWTIKLAAPAPK
jgi:hypothetical protein